MAKSSSRVATSAAPNTSAMSDAELFAYYRAIAHIEDVRFFLAVVQPSEKTAADTAILTDARALLAAAESGKIKRVDTLRQLRAIQIRWNTRNNPPLVDYAVFNARWKRMERNIERKAKRAAIRAHKGLPRRITDYLKRRESRIVSYDCEKAS